MSRPDTYLICVSNSQRRECRPHAQIEMVIPNGIRLSGLAVTQEKRNYVVALGRVCPEKAFHLAVDAADKAGIPLVLAGTVFGYTAHQNYFRDVLAPKLHSPHRFIGAVGGYRKRELLASARCLLVTSTVSETSSLVAMEAMACGTPVIAFRCGALPELVQHGRTGFLVDTPDEMADAIAAAGELSPRLCREHAEKNFSADRMAERYFDLYRAVSAEYASHDVQQEHAS